MSDQLRGGATVAGHRIWHAGNQGAGSGLDADLWDGHQFNDLLDQAVKESSSVRFAALSITGGINTGSTMFARGTGNDYRYGGLQVMGGGTDNPSVLPTLGFHQPGLFAGTLQQSTTKDFSFLMQDTTTLANLHVAPATQSTHAVTLEQINTYQGYYVGSIHAFPATQPPGGFIKANGAEISRVSYAALWSYAQNSGNLVEQGSKAKGNFGTGNGSTTFTLPDLRGVVIRGYDDGAGLDSSPSLGRYQGDDNRSHSHGASTGTSGWHNHSMNEAGNHNHGISSSGESGTTGNYIAGASYADRTISTSVSGNHAHSINASGNHTHTVSVSATGSVETTMKNVTLLYCIKY